MMFDVVVYDECIKKDERSENFHMNERVARELIRAFQHVCLKNCKIRWKDDARRVDG